MYRDATDQPGSPGKATRLPNRPGSQKLMPPLSAIAAFGAEAIAESARKIVAAGLLPAVDFDFCGIFLPHLTAVFRPLDRFSLRWHVRIGCSRCDRRILLQALLEIRHDLEGRARSPAVAEAGCRI